MKRTAGLALSGLIGALLVCAAPRGTEDAVANGDTRTIYLHHSHTGEDIAATYMKDGRYDPAVLRQLNHFLRDWRNDEETHMDPRLFDVIWETYRESGSQEPIWVVSAYRSPVTNAMLRRRSKAVAEHSQHMLGKAMDMHYLDVPMSKIRALGMRLERGGVGYYPTAGTPFVHLDVGGVRYWPRMTYAELMRLFPDGKAVFRAADGRTLPHYEEAVAELEQRGQNVVQVADAGSSGKSFFARLFHFGGDDEEDRTEAEAAPQEARRPTRVASLGTAATIEPPPPAPPAAPAAAQAEAQPRLGWTMGKPGRAQHELPRGETFMGTAEQTADRDELADATPMPPRRPSELAMLGGSDFAAPLPPSRPLELASLTEATPAPPLRGRVDRIAGLIGALPPASALPGVITRGTSASASGGPAGPVLAYAPDSAVSQAPSVPGLRLAPHFSGGMTAAVRTQRSPQGAALLSARLDPSDFAGLTGEAPLARSAPHTALGRSLVPLRAAARFDVARLGFDPVAMLPAHFAAAPAIPPADRFASRSLDVAARR